MDVNVKNEQPNVTWTKPTAQGEKIETPPAYHFEVSAEDPDGKISEYYFSLGRRDAGEKTDRGEFIIEHRQITEGTHTLYCWVVDDGGKKSEVKSIKFDYEAGDDNWSFDLGEGVILEMVWIPGGTFSMGSPESEEGRSNNEGPVHEVELDGFWMGKTEVTQEQYQAIVGSNPSYFKGPKNPVESISWEDAMEFCRKLSQRTGQTFTLPTEAQWEYACRAGTTTPFHFGDTISTIQANYDGNSTYGNGVKGEYRQRTVPAGSFALNAFGLYDMHGNVWEWCADWYGDYTSERQKNPTGPSTGSDRVFRGGCWRNDPRDCRSANRDSHSPGARSYSLGFRVCLSPVR